MGRGSVRELGGQIATQADTHAYQTHGREQEEVPVKERMQDEDTLLEDGGLLKDLLGAFKSFGLSF